ncbi:MAG: hypothetical protein RBT20_08730 [Syntrophales bacterium]|jgi:hypothetical protein|nr:hypothetical protein [Syntrophales bacterium]
MESTSREYSEKTNDPAGERPAEEKMNVRFVFSQTIAKGSTFLIDIRTRFGYNRTQNGYGRLTHEHCCGE